METIVCESREEACRRAAEIVAESLDRILSQQSEAVLAVAGGRSMPPVFSALASGDVPWGRVHVFMADERMVPQGHPDSNFGLVRTFLADPLKGRLPEKNLHPFGETVPEYSEELAKFGGFDLVLLSAGEDGHIASLFPRHRALYSSSENYLELHDSPKPPPDRVTAPKRLIEGSRAAVLLFLGEEKRAAYEAFKNDRVGAEACPAKLVKSVGVSYVLTDLK